MILLADRSVLKSFEAENLILAGLQDSKMRKSYLDTWDDFYAASEQLYLDAPEKFRFVVKYRHCDGKMVLKVTNNAIVIKYLSDQIQDGKKLDKLNSMLMRHMVSKS